MNPYLQPHFPFISISPIPSGILTESSYPWKYTLCSPLPLHPKVVSARAKSSYQPCLFFRKGECPVIYLVSRSTQKAASMIGVTAMLIMTCCLALQFAWLLDRTCYFSSYNLDVGISFTMQKRHYECRLRKITYPYFNGNKTRKRGHKQRIILQPNQTLP